MTARVAFISSSFTSNVIIAARPCVVPILLESSMPVAEIKGAFYISESSWLYRATGRVARLAGMGDTPAKGYLSKLRSQRLLMVGSLTG